MKVPVLAGSLMPAPHEKPWNTDQIRAWYQGLVEEQERQQRELIEQACEEGFNKGVRKGMCNILLCQLRVRFGPLPANALERIEAADVTTIERWAVRILKAQSLSEVFDKPS